MNFTLEGVVDYLKSVPLYPADVPWHVVLLLVGLMWINHFVHHPIDQNDRGFYVNAFFTGIIAIITAIGYIQHVLRINNL